MGERCDNRECEATTSCAGDSERHSASSHLPPWEWSECSRITPLESRTRIVSQLCPSLRTFSGSHSWLSQLTVRISWRQEADASTSCATAYQEAATRLASLFLSIRDFVFKRVREGARLLCFFQSIVAKETASMCVWVVNYPALEFLRTLSLVG